LKKKAPFFHWQKKFLPLTEEISSNSLEIINIIFPFVVQGLILVFCFYRLEPIISQHPAWYCHRWQQKSTLKKEVRMILVRRIVNFTHQGCSLQIRSWAPASGPVQVLTFVSSCQALTCAKHGIRTWVRSWRLSGTFQLLIWSEHPYFRLRTGPVKASIDITVWLRSTALGDQHRQGRARGWIRGQSGLRRTQAQLAWFKFQQSQPKDDFF
jgi:hypothetical protein